MNASAPLIETYLWLVVLTIWTVTGTLDLIARARGKEVRHAGT